MPRERISARTFNVLAGLLVAAALALRLRGLFHDLWLDEVWTWGIARDRQSAIGVFEVGSSNNHPLNTLVFYWIGDSSAAWAYRIHSLVAGLAAVALAVVAGRPFGRGVGLLAGFLVAVSFLMTAYSVEARGYAMEVAFGLAAFVAVRAWWERPRVWVLLVAWAAIVLGFLSQYLFVHVYGALGVWTVGRLVVRRAEIGAEIRRALVFHSFPLVLCAGLWFLVLRHVFNAGAPGWELADVMRETFGWSLGLPMSAATVALGSVTVAAVVAIDAVQLARAGRDEWIFQVAVVVVAPVATSLFLEDQYLCPRYFLVSLAFFLLALARVLASVARSGRSGLVAASALTVAFAIGNLAYVRAFLVGGRGGYRAAVERMGREDPSPVITVMGKYDFNATLMLDYYRRFLPPGQQIALYSSAKPASQRVEWILIDEQHFPKQPPLVYPFDGATYALRGMWTYYGPSGADWAIYRRAR